MAYLRGCHHVSLRGVEAIVETTFELPLSLGQVSTLETQLSEALAPAHTEALEAVRQAEVGSATAHLLFHGWQAYRGGTISREQRVHELRPVRAEFRGQLEDGLARRDAKVVALGANLLAVEPALWTFLSAEGGSRRTTTPSGWSAAACCGLSVLMGVGVRPAVVLWSAC
jgi:hypothetical protein